MWLSLLQLKTYERDGVLFPIPILSAEEAGRFREELEAIISRCDGGPPKRLANLHLFFDWAHQLVTHHALLTAIEDLLGDEILIDGTLVFYKPPQDSSYVSWHQDSVYSGWHLTPSTSAWIALTPSHQANGCMRVLRGSHQEGQLNHVTVPDDSNLLRRGERIEIVDESSAVDVILRPGEMSLHQSTIVHGSNPNSSGEPRIGFIVRFITDRIGKRDWPVLRVRGTADCSHLNLWKPPLGIDREAAFSAWRTFTQTPLATSEKI